MGNNKQMAINMIAQIITFIVNLGIGFFLTPFVVNNIGSDAYGFVGLANNFISYAQIVTIALNSMAGRFITISLHQNKYEETNKYFTSVLIANLVISTALTIAMVFILLLLDRIVEIPNDLMPDVTFLFALLFFNFIINVAGSAFGFATFSKNRLELASIRDIISNIIKVLILLFVYMIFQPSVWYIGLASAVSTGFIIVINIYFTKKLLPEVKIKKKYFDYQNVKILLFSGMWNSFTKLSGILSTGLDLLITNLFIGVAAMGSLSIAKTLPTMILSFFGMMASVFAAQLTISYAKEEMDGMRQQLISSIKILGIFSCIPMALLFAYGDIFFRLWMPTQDEILLQRLSIITSLALVFALPLEGLWNIFTVVNKVKQTSIFLFANSVATIVIVLIALFFTEDQTIKLYIIAGTSTIFSIARAITFLPLYGAYCLNLKLYTFYPAIIKNVLSVVFITLISLLIKNIIIINNWWMLCVATIVTTLISLLLNSVLILGDRERKMLISIATKRIKANVRT